MNEPHMAPWWFAANDHPRDKALMDISITVPEGKQVIANGRRIGRTVHGGNATTHWRADEPMVPYLAFFAAGSYAVDHGRRHGLPWYVAVSKQLPPRMRNASMRLMRQTPTLVGWLATQLGDYPFSATGGLATGLEPGFALENQTRPTYPAFSGGRDRTVVHELAHQWFGDSVAVENWRDIWLNEGAATFMEVRYTETHGGRVGRATGCADTTPDTTPTTGSGTSGSPTRARASRSSTAEVYYRGGDGAPGAAPPDRQRGLLDDPAHLGLPAGGRQRRHRGVRGARRGGQRARTSRVLRGLAAPTTGRRTPRPTAGSAV